MADPFLSIIIPVYNEESRIISTLDTLLAYLRGRGYAWELVVVDDGSTDDTAAITTRWASSVDEARVLSIPHAGKGSAVRHGMLNSKGQYRMMCDADMAMPAEYIDCFVSKMEEGFDIVIGSRQIAGARRFGESAMRHLMGRVFNKAVHALAVSDFQDTQCGYKCFRAEAAEKLFGDMRTNGWGFDVEILRMAIKSKLRVLEMPIDWYHQKDSKIRPGLDTLLMLRDVIKIRFRGRGEMDEAASDLIGGRDDAMPYANEKAERDM